MEEALIEIIKDLCKEDQNYIGDDCAIAMLGENKFLFCLDNFVEGTHFDTSYFSAADIGWKSLAINLSDIAAMAGKPLYALIGLSLNKGIADKEAWVKEFYTGLMDCAGKHGMVKVIGGDITSSQSQTAISITLIGEAPAHDYLRSNAKVGDKICVTGKFGNSANFLKSLQDDGLPSNSVIEEDKLKHLRPVPRLDEASLLLEKRAALIDSSDGLAVSLIEIAEQSLVDIDIDSSLIPKDEHVDIKTALYGGEDFELVCASESPYPGFTIIGEVVAMSTHPEVRMDGELLNKSQAFNHFSAGA